MTFFKKKRHIKYRGNWEWDLKMAYCEDVFYKSAFDKAHPLLQLFITHKHLINFNLLLPQKNWYHFTKLQNGGLK